MTGRHATLTPGRRAGTAALAASCVVLGGLITLGLSADGQTAQISGDQTCQFSITSGVVSTLSCAAPTTTPPPSPSASPTVNPTPTATKTSPAVTETPTQLPSNPAGNWPDATNTGIPAGTTLTTYTGPKTINTCQTIDSKTITGTLTITAGNGSTTTPCVTIRNSLINGTVQSGTKGPTQIVDTEINSGTNAEPSVVYGGNTTLIRANVHGGKANFQCEDRNCTIRDSWMHDAYFAAPYHYDVVGSNGVDGFDIEHNTLSCNFTNEAAYEKANNGGCSADLGFFGDFGPIQNVTVNGNLFKAGPSPGYCVITNVNKQGKAFPVGKNLVWTNNVFERGRNGKCGQYGPVDDWQNGNGNVWSGNTWDDGKALNE